MFDRFVRLAQARRLHAERRHDEALRKLRDPVVKDHRRAEELRSRVLDAILERARRRRDAGVLDAALGDARQVLVECPGHPGAEALEQELEAELAEVRAPTLILSWEGDPTHPRSTAERLDQLLPSSEWHHASDAADVLAWPGLVTDFVARAAEGS